MSNLNLDIEKKGEEDQNRCGNLLGLIQNVMNLDHDYEEFIYKNETNNTHLLVKH